LIVGQTQYSLNIWDTAGQEKYNALGYAFYRGTQCCGLVFDLSNPASFEKLDSWKKNFLDNAAPAEPEKFPFVLIGNKTDLERKVSADQVAAWRAKNDNMPYLETQATAGTKVEDAFRQMTETTSAQTSDSAVGAMPTSLFAANNAVALSAKDDK